MTLKIVRRTRLDATAATAAMTLTAVVFAGLALAGSASADHGYSPEPPTLNGDWAPFNRCPVDNPAMLAIEGTTTEAFCIAGDTPSGSMTTGNLTVAFKHTNHQYGVVQNREGLPSPGVSPAGGVLVAEPVELPGGIQGLICPGASHIAAWVCSSGHHHHGWGDGRANDVTWTLESAGDVSNFSLFAGLAPGVPIVTSREKIHLQSRWLGDDCYIGSEAEPIVSEPSSVAQPEVKFFGFAGNGAPLAEGEEETLADISSFGSQNATGFTVPAATGCGRHGSLDRAIDEKVGLPSSASTNSITFNENTTNLVGVANPESAAPNDGKVLSEYWHSAVISPVGGGHGSDHGHRDGRHWSRGGIEEDARSKFRLRH